MTQILSDAHKLNLVFSAFAVVTGLTIYWVWRPGIFQAHTFAERAYEFWLLKWMAAVIVWGFVAASTDKRFVLAAQDLSTVLGLGFVFATWKGDSYEPRRAHVNLLFVFGLLLSWDFVMNPLVGTTRIWLYPSMTAGLLVMALIAVTMVVRCRSQAVMFAVASALYLGLQLPTYQVIFGLGKETPEKLVEWLGFAKVFYCGLFYTVYPYALKSFAPIQLPHMPNADDRLKKIGSWAAVSAGGVVLTQLVLWIVKVVAQAFGHHAG